MATVTHGPDRATQPATAQANGWRTHYPVLAAEVDSLTALQQLADQLGLPRAGGTR